MRRSPLRAKGRSPSKPRAERKRTRYARRERDTDYMLRVKALPCVAAILGPCQGPVEADHAGRRGLGQKCPDVETIPLCNGHHRARTDFSGVFKTWSRDEMRAFLANAVVETQRLLGLNGREETPW